jgi:hypothetical protein
MTGPTDEATAAGARGKNEQTAATGIIQNVKSKRGLNAQRS